MKNKISLDGGKTWTTGKEAMNEIVRRGICMEIFGIMIVDPIYDEIRDKCKNMNIGDRIDEYLRAAEDGIVITDPVYDKDTFVDLIEGFLFDNYTDEWLDGKAHIDYDSIEYDDQFNHWEAVLTFDDDNCVYALVGYESREVSLEYSSTM